MKRRSNDNYPKEVQKKLRRFLMYEIMVGLMLVAAIVIYLRYM